MIEPRDFRLGRWTVKAGPDRSAQLLVWQRDAWACWLTVEARNRDIAAAAAWVLAEAEHARDKEQGK